ncbi:MAG TPA: hypothetical protein VFC05_00980 [Nitrososphaeraceae archaeon]|jgi:hypothetical protein|nr:hypothetical protein [Nitrososphaeraceae archaeon]
MKFLYAILLVVTTTMVAPLSLFSSTYDELVYAQQHKEENQTIDIQQEEQMNLNLGKPIYTEIFTAPKSHDKLTSSVYSFSGNGTINGMEISSSGNGLIIPREDGTSAVTDGRALFTSKNGGNASYSFEAIINIKENVTRHLGAAFFDANATGNLEFLQSVVGVYKAVLDEKGTFTMWQLK